MSRWTVDAHRAQFFETPQVQPACDTCGGNGQKSFDSSLLPNGVAETLQAQGFSALNQSLNQALYSHSSHQGRPGVLVLGAGPTSSADLEASLMHELQIASILKDTAGVSPNDIHVGFVRDLSTAEAADGESSGLQDSPKAFKAEVIKAFCRELNNTTEALYTAQTNIATDPTLERVGQINMSFTMSPKIGADVLFERLEYTDSETGEYLFPELRRAVYGRSPSKETNKRYQKALNYVQTVVSNSSAIQQARDAYQQQVISLKEQGVRCIVAVGNENSTNYGADVSDGEAFNLFCTPDTINVGAAKANGDVADFSSRSGSQNDTTPTVMTLGQAVPVALQWDKLDGKRDGRIDGTSFAAPQVAGLLSHLNQYNDLSAAQENAWLATLQDKGIIVDTDAPQSAEGMGWFNPVGFDVAA
ncbi:MAG: S8/S53 family peptidase [Vampirovibrionales bacterium]|nr:S8/S53 family peptidase [Vampirovibrionales bacterium]